MSRRTKPLVWTDAHVERLRALAAAGKSASAIGVLMNVRTSEIRERAEEHGIQIVPPRGALPLSEVERARVRELATQGVPILQIARQLGRSQSAVGDLVRTMATRRTDNEPPLVPLRLTLPELIAWSRRPGGRLARAEAGL